MTGDNAPPEVAHAMQNARMLLDAIKLSVHDDRVEAEATEEYAPAIQAFLDLMTPRVEKKTTKSKPTTEMR
jgi:hypothetical protein